MALKQISKKTAKGCLRLLTMKKTLKLFLLTLLAAVSLCAFAGAAELSGECGVDGGNVTWHLNTDSGVMTISGSGDMRDLEYSESLWGEESAHIKTVIVEEGVTSIGDFAFQNCNTENLTAVQLPESLKEIGKRAFGECGALTQINFPKKLKVIDRYAFSGCSALPSAILPDSVTVLGSGAFESCWALTEVKLPAWLGTIEYGLFDGCMELRSIVIPHQVTKIDACAFQNCKKLNTIYLPKSLTKIGSLPKNGTTYHVYANSDAYAYVSQNGYQYVLTDESAALPAAARLVRARAEMTNLRTCRRLLAMGAGEPGEVMLSRAFLPGGVTELETLLAAYREGESGFAALVAKGELSRVFESADPAEVDLAMDNAYLALAKEQARVAYGAEVAIGYLVGVEYAVKNLRILLVAKETGADDATLGGRLRENYV